MRLAAIALLALGGCGARVPVPVDPTAAATSWRTLATPDDRRRVREWRTAWTEGLRQARAAGHGPAIAGEGALLHPDAGIAGAGLPVGDYACRVVKLGSQGAGLAYVSYPAFRCRVSPEGGRIHLAKLTGSQRPVGHLYPEGDARAVFLGVLMLGDERRAMRYGQDRDRDVAGVVERIAPQRWRLVLPYPRFESMLDVIELVPS